jgi:FkbM family methyltransferase
MKHIFDYVLLFSNAKILKDILLRRPVSITSFHNVRNIKNYEENVKTFIDVGANKGQFAFAVLNFFPTSKIYCFEPSQRNFAKLKNNLSRYANIILFNDGLGEAAGEFEFYDYQYDQISSLLKIHTRNDNPNYKNSEWAKSTVSIKKLDEVIEHLDVISPSLLKLDVQGFEDKVLLGSVNALKKIDYLMIELPFVELYENQKLFHEMHPFISGLGFSLLAPLGFNTGKKNTVIEMDALYVNVARKQ